MVNVYNRLLAYEKLPVPGLAGGVLPVAPPNRLSMLHDYIEPSERAVACPNQDVVYGQSVLALDREPVVVQVPDFGDRFWVYQIVDQRTDGFATIGKMYGTKPGFYLLTGPDWNKGTPKGIDSVFQATTKLGMFIPRVFMDDSPEDRVSSQQVINQIDAYPLSAFDGKAKNADRASSEAKPTSSDRTMSGSRAGHTLCSKPSSPSWIGGCVAGMAPTISSGSAASPPPGRRRSSPPSIRPRAGASRSRVRPTA
jgi:hypothetical protein